MLEADTPMLTSTFCHIPGIGLKEEQRLWSAGLHSWEMISAARLQELKGRNLSSLGRHIEESFLRLEKNDVIYFTDGLPSDQHWRLFPDFRHSIAYLDIETTGLGYGDSITTIAVYDGIAIRHYVNGENLKDFRQDIKQYRVIVTYNGKSFDVPFIERCLGIRLRQAHIDLRYVLKDLGYTGGLKACERNLGVVRKGIEDVDGYFAVLLWQDYLRSRDRRSLETLLAYNIQDVINLESLLIKAYNMNLRSTPFSKTRHLDHPSQPDSPFEADRQTIDRIKKENYWMAKGFTRRY
jgi:hypothetical protein